MIVSTESTKETTKHLIKPISEVIEGYKVNTQELIAVLYTTSNKLLEKIFTVASKKKHKMLRYKFKKVCLISTN